MALARRPADAQPGYREYLVGQAQDLAGAIDVVADDADRATAQPRSFCREDESLH